LDQINALENIRRFLVALGNFEEEGDEDLSLRNGAAERGNL
jgi:hypothetical protein